jgi:adenylosuccinate lyase
MQILPIDTGRYGSPEIKRIFEERNRLQYQLEFEGALAVAKAQAQINMIPAGVAKEIVKIAKSMQIILDLFSSRTSNIRFVVLLPSKYTPFLCSKILALAGGPVNSKL